MAEAKELSTIEIEEGGSHAHTLFAEPIFHYGSFAITNALITSWVAVFILIIISLIIRSKIREIPGKLQSYFEVIIEGALGLCDQVTNNRALSIRIFPFVYSLYRLFISSFISLTVFFMYSSPASFT